EEVDTRETDGKYSLGAVVRGGHGVEAGELVFPVRGVFDLDVTLVVGFEAPGRSLVVVGHDAVRGSRIGQRVNAGVGKKILGYGIVDRNAGVATIGCESVFGVIQRNGHRGEVSAAHGRAEDASQTCATAVIARAEVIHEEKQLVP